MNKTLIKKILIIAVPTYAMAFLTNSMVYTMPMLAITTIISTNVFQDDRDIENRVDEDGDSSNDDNDDAPEQAYSSVSSRDNLMSCYDDDNMENLSKKRTNEELEIRAMSSVSEETLDIPISAFTNGENDKDESL